MTFNVGNGLARPTQLAEVLKASESDVIGLQELAIGQAETLSHDLAATYPFQMLAPGGFAGKGLLSRHRILHHTPLTLYPERDDLHAVIGFDGVSLTVLVVHPPPPRLIGTRITFDGHALKQLETLAVMAVQHAPSVLMGDFNMTRRNAIYARLVEVGLEDAFAVAGSGRGWTLPRRLGHASRLKHRLQRLPLRPMARVDYIWYTRELHAEAAWVGSDAGSDHLPVLARLAPRAPT